MLLLAALERARPVWPVGLILILLANETHIICTQGWLSPTHILVGLSFSYQPKFSYFDLVTCATTMHIG
jgi:hypothetical protein